MRQGVMEMAESTMMQDYLKLLYTALERGDDGVSVSELAERMDVAPSTASENVRRLASAGLVAHEPYQRVHLTDEGRRAAVAMVRRHRLLETYLYRALAFPWDAVHREAEVLEHAISDELLEHIDQALGHPDRDPHGDPIPTSQGREPTSRTRNLTELGVGQASHIVRITDQDPELLRNLQANGLVIDALVEVDAREPWAGTLRLWVTPPSSWRPREGVTPLPGVAPGARHALELSTDTARCVVVGS